MIDPLASLPGYLLRRASTAMFAKLARQLEVIGLTPVEGSVLTVINMNLGVTQVELCRLLDIKKANMTPRIAKLEEAGLVRRNRIDGRSSGLFLTEQGAERQKCAWDIMQAHEQNMLTQIGAEHAEHFVPALKILWTLGLSES